MAELTAAKEKWVKQVNAIADLDAELLAVREEQSVPAVTVNFKALAKDLVENLVDCDAANDEAVEQYLAYAEKTCRAAMLGPRSKSKSS